MADTSASARGQWTAILASPLRELTGFYLAVDYLGPDCGGERTFTIAETRQFLRPGKARSATCCAGCAAPAAVAVVWVRRGWSLGRSLTRASGRGAWRCGDRRRGSSARHCLIVWCNPASTPRISRSLLWSQWRRAGDQAALEMQPVPQPRLRYRRQRIAPATRLVSLHCSRATPGALR